MIVIDTVDRTVCGTHVHGPDSPLTSPPFRHHPPPIVSRFRIRSLRSLVFGLWSTVPVPGRWEPNFMKDHNSCQLRC